MENQTCKTPGRPKACPKESTELFYVTHPKAPKALPEYGRVIMRSADVVVTACLIELLDDLTYWHAINNGRVVRAFAGADRQGGARHE